MKKKTNVLRAFHNDPKIKAKYLRRVRAHEKADEIIKGTYFNDEGKGCAVGCTIHSGEHAAYETELGIPEWLACVEDTLFEGMPVERSKTWPREFLSAIKPGMRLEKIKTPFIVVILKHSIKSMRAAKYDETKNPRVKKAIDQSEAAIREMIRCREKGLDLSAARSTAYSAARSAARSAANAAYSAARSAANAAYSAARSAARSAANAADSAASAADSAVYSAASAARSAAYEYFADELLKLIKKCK